MALPTPTGLFDGLNEKIVGPNTGLWADIGAGDSAGDNDIQTWDDWKSWQTAPSSFNWLTVPVDLGEAAWINLVWTIECVGTPSFTVYYSTTGDFAGEESTQSYTVDQTDIDAIYARFVIIEITMTPTSEGLPEISTFEWSASGNRFEIIQYDVNSTTLNGSSSARQIAMPRTVSKVLQMQITTHASAYVEDDYVASGYIDDSAPGFPAIVSKTRTAPEITFISTAGSKVDAVFDVTMNVLPEQYMDGRNLRTR